MDNSPTKGHFTRVRTIEGYRESSYSAPRLAGLRITQSYYNYTGELLYFAHRNNMIIPLAMEDKHLNIPKSHTGKLIIEQQFVVAYNRVDDFINQLMLDVERDNDKDHIEQHCALEAITTGEQIEKSRSGLIFTLRYIVGGKHIERFSQGIYLTNLDILIGYSKENLIHPYSAKDAQTIFNRYRKDSFELKQSNFTVTLVDNAKRFNTLYININGDAMEVIPTESARLEDGVWITRSSHTSGKVKDADAVFVGGPNTVRFDTLECLDTDNYYTPMLYYSPQECITYGNEIKLLEKKYQLEKIKLEAEAREREEKIKQQEDARRERDHQRKMDEMERKARVDRVKDERSVGVEILKIGGALVTGIGIALAAVAKMRD